ncbi:MAG: helix-turn-helix domain-containing protein [Nitrososphaerales archaeon]
MTEEIATASPARQGDPQQEVSEQQLELKYQLAELRRGKVLQLLSRGLNQTEAAQALGVDKSTVCRDMQQLRESAKNEIQHYITETLPLEHRMVRAAIDDLIRHEWRIIAQNQADPKTLQRAIEVTADLYRLKLEVLGDCPVLTEAMSAVGQLRRKLTSPEEHQEEVEVLP